MNVRISAVLILGTTMSAVQAMDVKVGFNNLKLQLDNLTARLPVKGPGPDVPPAAGDLSRFKVRDLADVVAALAAEAAAGTWTKFETSKEAETKLRAAKVVFPEGSVNPDIAFVKIVISYKDQEAAALAFLRAQGKIFNNEQEVIDLLKAQSKYPNKIKASQVAAFNALLKEFIKAKPAKKTDTLESALVDLKAANHKWASLIAVEVWLKTKGYNFLDLATPVEVIKIRTALQEFVEETFEMKEKKVVAAAEQAVDDEGIAEDVDKLVAHLKAKGKYPENLTAEEDKKMREAIQEMLDYH